MRSRATFFTLLFAVSLFALPLFAHAAAIPFFGPIIPSDCSAGFGMLVEVINNIIRVLLTLAIVFVAPLMIAYSGFLFVVNPVNAGGREEAKKILTNTITGIVISLAAWMIVGAVMAVLYEPTKVWGTWTDLLLSGDSAGQCIEQAGSVAGPSAPAPGVQPVVSAPVGKAYGICALDNHACGPTWIQLAAQALNMNLSDAQKNALSCIAMTESSGNPNTPDSPTGACGTFQITNRTVDSNWQNPAYHTSPCTVASSCNDAQCNLQTALILFSKRGYQPWTGKKPNGTYWNSNAVTCVRQNDPNTSSRT
jgi:hypothetical protein